MLGGLLLLLSLIRALWSPRVAHNMVVAVLESPVGSWAALGVLVVSAIALVWFTKRKQAGLPFPPGPKAKPLIGNMLDMPQRKEVETFDKWHRQYGSSHFHSFR